jgi:two-component system sensor histidine kinase BaeS
VDAQRIEQVLANLLENALRHAVPPGPVTLVARTDGERILLSVADTGPGVPADALPRLFDRLYRVEAARTRAGGGSGLGLAICKSIVEAHGGTIEARASSAGGLEVVVELPVGAPSGATGPAQRVAPEGAPT